MKQPLPVSANGSLGTLSSFLAQSKGRRAKLGLLAAALATTIAPSALQAQVDQTWAGGESNVWSTGALNWDLGAGWTNGNNAIFGGTWDLIEIDGSINVGNITFDSDGYIIGDTDNNGTLNFALPSTITVTTGKATINEVIASGGITKAGAGELILSAANTYDGLTTVNQGRLRVGNDLALGTGAGATIVNVGGEVLLEDGVSVTGETITIAGSGVSHGGSLTNSGAYSSWGGTINLTGTARVGAAAGGMMEISGPIKGETLEVAGALGTGIVLISGTNNTYTGHTQIVRGTLQLGATNALPVGTVLNVDSSTATEDAIFDLSGFNQTVAGLIRGVSIDEGGAGAVLNFGETASTLTITTLNAVDFHTFTGLIMDGTSPVSIVKTGAGTQTLSGANTFSGDVSVRDSNSVLRVGHANALGDTTGVTIASGGGRVMLNNGVTVTGETIRISDVGDSYGAIQASGTATWDGPVLIDNNNARVGTRGGVLTLSGDIKNGTAGNTLNISVTNNGTTGAPLGTLIISGTNNTYTGNTNIMRGIVKIGAHNALPTTTTLNVDSFSQAITEDAIFDLNGFNQTVAGLASSGADLGANLAVILNNGAAPSTFTLNQASGTSTYTGFLRDGSSQLALTKAGAGTLALTKAHDYTGATNVNGGTLEIRSTAGALASTSINVNGSGSWLALDNVASGSNGNRILDTANVTLNRGNLSLRGANDGASSETIGSITLGPGLSQIKVTHGTAQNATLTADLLRSADRGTALVSGIDLGKDGTSSTGVGRILFSNTPTLIGTTDALASGRNTSAKDTKIVPYLVGEFDTATGAGRASGIANTFVTYHENGGVRPLDIATELAIDEQVDGANTRLLTSMTFTGGTEASPRAVNSLLMSISTPSGQPNSLFISGKLGVTSGAILFTNSSNISNGTIDFGTAEGIISVTSGSTATIGSKIEGSGGLSLNGPGDIGLGSSISDYTGGTFVQGGAVIVPQSNSLGGAGAALTSGPFGKGDLIFNGGGIRSAQGTAYTVGNSIKLRGDLAIAASGNHLTLTGPVTIEGGSRTITNSSASTTRFTGAIGDGSNGYGLTLKGNGTGAVHFEGTNTYTGPTNLESGNLVVSGSIAGATFVGNPAAPADTAVLRGAGTLGTVSALTSGASIDPGNAVDATAILNTGALSLSNGAHLSMQIGGITAGASLDGHDQIVAAGQVSLTGGDLKLSLLGTPAFNSSTTLFLVANNSGLAIDGAFTTLNGLAFDPGNILLGGQQFALVYNANFSGVGTDGIANDLALVAVPEPTSAAMLLAGLATLGFSRAGRRLRREQA